MKGEEFLVEIYRKRFFLWPYFRRINGFFVIPYKEVESVGDGATETTYLNLSDFIIHLIRFRVVILNSFMLKFVYGM
ncbi:hypothetical protein J2W44_003290 [Priestia aryabhattai]|nr:hypothetical protein [Priestia aryabhattai]